jgi:hypothetical protein
MRKNGRFPSYNSAVPMSIQTKANTKPPKNDPKRQEVITSLFHARDWDKIDGKEVKE